MEGEEREGKTIYKLLALWAGRERKWLTYKEIVIGLQAHRISERTVDRYLSTLVREGKLIRKERGYKKTFYRPHDQFWEAISHSREQFRISEESLSRIGKSVMDALNKSIIDAEETTKQIEKLVQKEVDKLPENEKDTDEGIEKAIEYVLSGGSLNDQEHKTLVSLVGALLRNVCLYLSNPYVFGRIVSPEDLASILDDDIRWLVSSYMKLWSFLYEHPAAVPEFKGICERSFGKLSIR